MEPQPGARQQPGGALAEPGWVLAGQAAWVLAGPPGSGSGMRQRVTSKPRAPSLPTWWAIRRRAGAAGAAEWWASWSLRRATRRRRARGDIHRRVVSAQAGL